MGRVREAGGRDRLILDAGALIALARGDVRTRAIITRALDDGMRVEVPTPVLAQVHRGGRDRAKTDRALLWIDQFTPTTTSIARAAGELLGKVGLTDAIAAIVAAEALEGTPAAILTGDPTDLTALVEAGNGSRRVAVYRA
jgi:predicted nucleic acid-binding protein